MNDLNTIEVIIILIACVLPILCLIIGFSIIGKAQSKIDSAFLDAYDQQWDYINKTIASWNKDKSE